MKKGNIEDERYITWIICDMSFEKGIIYKKDDSFINAYTACEDHIQNEHYGIVKYLLGFSKKEIGLSEIQKEVFKLFLLGKSDFEIADSLGKSVSTIRNHRFILKEKARQSKIFLTLMSFLLQEDDKTLKVPRRAKMVDERYMITQKDVDKTLESFIINDKLISFPAKEKKKIIILRYIIKRFEAGRKYSEKEVNQIISDIFEDYATIRRYFIEYGFMDRTRDCSLYWVNL